jgi:hypothetical protein
VLLAEVREIAGRLTEIAGEEEPPEADEAADAPAAEVRQD